MALADVAAALNNIPTPWAVAFAGYLGVLNYDVDTLCASPPPATPSISFADMLALTSLDSPVAHLTAVKKFSDAIEGWLWPQLCQCSGGGAPTAPTPPTAPSPLPVVSPPILPFQVATPCYDKFNEATIDLNGPGNTNISLGLILAGAVTGPYTFTTKLVWAKQSGTSGQLWGLTFYYTDAANVLQTSVALSTSPAGDSGTFQSVAVTLPANTKEFHLQINQNGVASEVMDFQLEVKMWCNGSLPTTPQSSCCPPDPSLGSAIANLQNWVQLIYSALPGAAGSLAENAVHAGLTGGGTITLGVNTIAVKVAITSDTSGLPTGVGVPTFLFDRGFIVPIAVEGPIRGQVRLVYNPQLYTLPTYTDQVGYQLAPGVTASITELTRGP